MGNICFVPLEGGESVSFAIGNPAAQANWLYTIPTGYEYEIRAIQCKLTTDANPANRQPLFVIYDNAANDMFRLYFTQVQVASIIGVYSLSVLHSRADFSLLVTAGNRHYNDTLPFVRLLPAFQIGAAFSGLQVTDQWSEIRILAHRWRTQ